MVEQFEVSHPDAVVRRGGDTYVAYELAEAVIDEAERRGIWVLGLEGFVIDGDATYPAFSRITDFSANTDQHSGAAAARNLLQGAWRIPPDRDGQINSLCAPNLWGAAPCEDSLSRLV